ncbi:YdeI/OmpD-associated family protein [Sphingobacterium sp. SRCM116780]|uniref:YdeI/OmpD-associated family protein n=1 Tax=Sphingobacterium sp. SRCM116780 TaxID=2907623 RepID=UPI001F168309|nr:YdeI/OmpD-associated family protein [Sphingobacterium sp. SRCM116780]UIR57499.1 YdeI/OmpD-associated family protein [Sphingobacterium sp. SRCM116780]
MKNPKVDEYVNKATKWQDEIIILRRIVLDCQLTEELKWRIPCYTYNNSNVLLINSFKDYCEIGFFKGVLLSDEHAFLISHGENSQSSRSIQFTNVQDILDKEVILKAYIFEAIEVEKAGLKVELKKTEDFFVPAEFEEKLKEDKALKTAFEALTPGRQRAYLLYFAAPKQSKTRLSRIEKSVPLIMMGKGLTDCLCGLSKRMPYCDGSHKYIQSSGLENNR